MSIRAKWESSPLGQTITRTIRGDDPVFTCHSAGPKGRPFAVYKVRCDFVVKNGTWELDGFFVTGWDRLREFRNYTPDEQLPDWLDDIAREAAARLTNEIVTPAELITKPVDGDPYGTQPMTFEEHDAG